MKLICPRRLRGFLPLSLSLSVGHLRRLQIIIVRSVMLSSSCYHVPSEYGTRSGSRSDVRKGAVSLTENTPYCKHIIDTLTDITAEIYWRTEYTGDQDSPDGMVTRCGLDGREVESRRWGEIFRTRPHRPWSPLSLQCQECRDLPGGTADRSFPWPTTTSSADVKKLVEL
jgi:hypothetical protein